MDEGISSPRVVAIECCELLVGSTFEEIAERIRASWITGQKCVDLVRADLRTRTCGRALSHEARRG